jgi:hypothetical protein
MSTDRRPNTVVLDFNNPSCILWAVLALARLDHKIPSNGKARFLSDGGPSKVYMLRETLDYVIGAFCDESMESTWSTISADYSHWAQLITHRFNKTAVEYYAHAPGGGQTGGHDFEIEYLFEIFQSFYYCLESRDDTAYSEAFGALGMLMAVAHKMAHVYGKIIADMFNTVLSEIGFPSRAGATKFAPHGRQGLFGPLGEFGIAFRRKPCHGPRLTSGVNHD